MKRKLLIVGIAVLLLLVVGLSGCNENKKNEENTMTYDEMISNLIYEDSVPTLKGYKTGDIIILYDTVQNVSYDEQENKTMVSFSDGKFGQYFLNGNQVSDYFIGKKVKIETQVQQYSVFDKNVIWLDNWYENYQFHYIRGMIPEHEQQIPLITFSQDDQSNRLLVIQVNYPLPLWSDIEITGTANTANLGTNVEAGDEITSCSGTITLTYLPTNTVLGTWTFV